MSIASTLAAGRERAESGMTDTCRITKSGGEPVLDEETGEYVDPPRITVYEGKCRVQVPNVAESNPDAGERQWTVQAAFVQLPIEGTEDARVGQRVEMLSVVHDSALQGRTYRVTGLHHKSHATSRRLRCEEATG